MQPDHVVGDLLDQNVDVIVNPWNRNILPWWLLLPQGVSGAIKRRAGTGPFRELARMGIIPAGGAVLTSAGRLPFRAIIHVASLNLLWVASASTITACVRSAMRIAEKQGFESVAMPLIGAGTGGGRPEEVRRLIDSELSRTTYTGRVIVVSYVS